MFNQCKNTNNPFHHHYHHGGWLLMIRNHRHHLCDHDDGCFPRCVGWLVIPGWPASAHHHTPCLSASLQIFHCFSAVQLFKLFYFHFSPITLPSPDLILPQYNCFSPKLTFTIFQLFYSLLVHCFTAKLTFSISLSSHFLFPLPSKFYRLSATFSIAFPPPSLSQWF